MYHVFMTTVHAGLLTAEEVAARLGMAPKTIYNWHSKGEGPRSTRVGTRSIRWRLEDVEAYLDERNAGSSSLN